MRGKQAFTTFSLTTAKMKKAQVRITKIINGALSIYLLVLLVIIWDALTLTLNASGCPTSSTTPSEASGPISGIGSAAHPALSSHMPLRDTSSSLLSPVVVHNATNPINIAPLQGPFFSKYHVSTYQDFNKNIRTV